MNKYAYLSIVVATTLLLCFATFALLSDKSASTLFIGMVANFPLCLLLCIINYTIIRRLAQLPLLSRHTSLRVAADWLCTTAIGCALSLALRVAIGADDDWRTPTMTFILWNSMAVMGIELYVYHCSILETRTLLERAEREKAIYQLETLKKQISPHFLFNSLNALASLTYQDAEKANLFTKKLSAVYRYLLVTADRQLVTLSEELRFLSSYLYLEEIRFGCTLQTHIHIADRLAQKKIVPASLQLLVENSLKHNIATEANPLHVSIEADGNAIIVKNNYQPRGDVASSKKGLDILRQQYAVLGLTINVIATKENFTVSIPLI